MTAAPEGNGAAARHVLAALPPRLPESIRPLVGRPKARPGRHPSGLAWSSTPLISARPLQTPPRLAPATRAPATRGFTRSPFKRLGRWGSSSTLTYRPFGRDAAALAC